MIKCSTTVHVDRRIPGPRLSRAWRWGRATELFRLGVPPGPFEDAAVCEALDYLWDTPRFLYDLRTFSQTYRRDFLEHCALRRMADGSRVSFEHLNMLVIVKSEKQRLEILEKVFAESLSLRELASIVGSVVSARPRLVTQRKLPKPTCPLRAAAQLDYAVKRINDYFPLWSEVLVNGMKTLDPAADTVLLSRLHQARAEVHALVTNFGPHLDTAIGELEYAFAKQPKEGGQN